MRIFRSFEEATVINSPVVTTGTFDGVHMGHKTIIRRLRKLASEFSGESTLITFHPHPTWAMTRRCSVIFRPLRRHNRSIFEVIAPELRVRERPGV